MNSKLLVPVGLVLAAVVAAIVIFAVLDTSEPVVRQAVAEDVSADIAGDIAVTYADLPTTGAGAGPDLPGTASAIPALPEALAADTVNHEAAREAVLELIDEATVTYDVQGLAVLAPLLQHADREIREATIEGIVQLGETAGAKTLREAARRAKDPREAALMIEGAQFLEVPVYTPAEER